MLAYALIFFAIGTRVFAFSHPVLLNFTAVGAALLYFGAKRPLREAVLPIALFAGVDYLLTVFAYGYSFHVGSYLVTWLWYGGILWLGSKMLSGKPGVGRVAGGAVLSSTSFFFLSNFVVWLGSAMYPHSIGGLGACFAAGLPFYRNDVLSTLLISAVLFSAPSLVRRMARPQSSPAAI